ncbi:type IV secretion protein Rhs [Capnocytophaga sp. HP1101]
MKRIIAIALLATTVAFGQNQKKNGWERAKLNGKVKTFVQTGFQVTDDGQEIPMNSELFTQFNKKGTPVKMLSKQQGMTINFVDVYDKEGHMLESASRDDSNTLLSKNVYEYDERGNLIKHDVETPDGSIFISRISAYNDKDQLVERTECMAGNCQDKTTYVYNPEGKVSEESKFTKDELTSKTLYTYDAKGNVIEKQVFDKDNVLKQRVTSTFDKNDNEVEVKYFDKDGNVTKTETYEFVYDKKNNWTKKTMLVNGKRAVIFTQKLKYY